MSLDSESTATNTAQGLFTHAHETQLSLSEARKNEFLLKEDGKNGSVQLGCKDISYLSLIFPAAWLKEKCVFLSVLTFGWDGNILTKTE